MTQSAIMLDEQQAVIAANTRMVHVHHKDGAIVPGGHTTKVLPIPHMNAALMYTGAHAFGMVIYMQLLMSGVEDIAEAVPELWPHLDDGLAQMGGEMDAPESFSTFYAVLAGWSRTHDSMAAFGYSSEGGAPEGALLEFVAALPGELPGLQDELAAFQGVKPSTERVIDIARLQYAAMPAEERADKGFGGHLTILEMDRGGMQITERRDPFGEQKGNSLNQILSAAGSGQTVRASGL